MRRGMLLLRNAQTCVPVRTAQLAQELQSLMIVAERPHWDLGVMLTDDAAIAQWNARFRGKAGPTDILSFPYHDLDGPGSLPDAQTEEDANLGDMVISVETVQRFCNEEGVEFEDRMRVLCAHGMAHLLGHDHQTEEEYALMQGVEEHLLACLPAFLHEVDRETTATVLEGEAAAWQDGDEGEAANLGAVVAGG